MNESEVCVSGFSVKIQSKLVFEMWDEDKNKYIILTRWHFLCFCRFILSELFCSVSWWTYPYDRISWAFKPSGFCWCWVNGKPSRTTKNQKRNRLEKDSSNFNTYTNYLRVSFWNENSDSLGLRWSPWFCISTRLPGDYCWPSEDTTWVAGVRVFFLILSLPWMPAVWQRLHPFLFDSCSLLWLYIRMIY